MATDEFTLEDLDDEKTIEFIKNYLPQDLKDKFSDDELYYFLDVITDYYTKSGCLDVQPDKDGYIEIDHRGLRSQGGQERPDGRLRPGRHPFRGARRNGVRKLARTGGIKTVNAMTSHGSSWHLLLEAIFKKYN